MIENGLALNIDGAVTLLPSLVVQHADFTGGTGTESTTPAPSDILESIERPIEP